MATPEGARHRDVEQRFRDLERKHRELVSRALQRPKYAVTEGDLTISGGALIVDGGDFLLLDTDGSTVFRLGPQQHGDRGVSLYREDGTVVLSTARQFASDTVQRWSMRDNAGNQVVSEQLFGDGLGRPYLSLPLQPVGPAGTPAPTLGPYGPERAVTATSFTDVFRWEGPRQNRWYRPVFNVRMSDTATAAEVRVVDDAGTVLPGFTQPAWTGVVAAGSTADTTVQPGYGLGMSNAFMSTQVLRVQVRRTAGTGTVSVSVRQSIAGGA